MSVSVRRALAVASVLLFARAATMCATGEPRRESFEPSPPPPLVVPTDTGAPTLDAGTSLPACPGGETTSISGTVYAPNGTLPIYNAIVYVPSEPLAPLPNGVTCDRCGSLVSGKPVAATLTDATGRFVLKDVPAGTNVPLVMQVGKWRRQITVPSVEACKDNLADATDTQTDPRLKQSQITRLPRSRSEGDLPKIAVTTGGCDPIPCLLPKLGLDADEYGAGFSAKAVNFYLGATGNAPSSPPPATELWGDLTLLKQYDVVLHSCECAEHVENKGAPAWEAMKAYVDLGGRLFTTDFGYTFIQKAPAPWSSIATWDTPDAWKPVVDGGDFPINQTFPKGKALAEWLDHTGGASAPGSVALPTVFDNATALDETLATRWVSSGAGNAPKVFTFNAPVGADAGAQCGRVSFGDAHIFSQFENFVGGNFPKGCKEQLNDREKVIAFLFFDVTACVVSDLVPQEPPPIVK